MEYNPLKVMLMRHEGLRLKPYRDTVGKLTIGYGRNLDDVGITQQEAIELLNNDIARTIATCRRAFPWLDTLNDARMAAVVSLVFNMGLAGFQTFKKAIAAMEAGDWEEAAKQLLDSKWQDQVGQRALEIAEIVRTGEYAEGNR